MNHHLLAGNPPLRIHLRRSAQARRMSLRVSSLDGKVTLTVPRFVSESDALDFAREKEEWLRGHCEKQPEPCVVALGQSIPFEGRSLVITKGAGRSVRVSDGLVLVPGYAETVARRVQAFLKQMARDRLADACDRHSKVLGRSYSRLTLRDTRSRWGSCSGQGALMFSWRLIMAPPEVLDYVAAHEVAHLEEMNHSRAFWNVVEKLYGDCLPARKWLHENGTELHKYRFEN